MRAGFINPQYRIPLIVAVAFHAMLLISLIMFSPNGKQYRAPSMAASKPVVQAVAVSDQAVIKAMTALTRVKQAKQRAADQALRRSRAKRRRVEHQLAAQRTKSRKQAQLLRKTKHDQAVASASLAKAKAAQRRVALRRAKEKKRLAKKALSLQQALAAKQLAGEKHALHRANQRGMLNEYRARIISQIESHWVLPGYADPNASCQLLVHLAAGGKVISVSVLHSSGSSTLDRSARLAVMHASPLPVPKDPALFSSFKTLRLTLRPQELRRS